jgi:hypothetical protein
MNPCIPKPVVPIARALFLVGGDRDQDDVEAFQELWRQHHDASASVPSDALAGVLPQGGSIALRASSLTQTNMPQAASPGSARIQAAKAQLKHALANVTKVPFRRRR